MEGEAVIKRYWSSEEQDAGKISSCFYDDDQGHWMKTGDRAVAAENGKMTIVGRYKNRIIRGGENIAPSAIESVFAQNFGITTEVVGIPDEIAGEVPVAVVNVTPDQDLNLTEVKEKITQDLGRAFVIEQVITLANLGIDDFPKTPTGKVQKNKLRDKVVRFLELQENEDTFDIKGTTKSLTKLWAKVLGIIESTLTPQTSIHDFTDRLVYT